MSQDPNNTQWSKSTDSYGHKILSAQGWKPGDYLGAENASHADHYTGANASHIRVLLREDNLGLGAQVGRVNAETFGLSLFSGVLGRLNGKSDAEVQKHQSALRDAELRTYQARKYGHMNFVYGGFLVGDRIESSAEYDSSSSKEDAATNSGAEDAGRRWKKHKNEVDPVRDERKKKRKRMERQEQETNARFQDEAGASKETEDVTLGPRAKEKSRKKSKSSQKAKPIHDSDTATAEDDKSRRKKERRALKEERRKRKEDKGQSSTTAQPVDNKQRQSDDAPEAPSAPNNAGIFAGNRNAVRRRYIEQKRMASLDPKAMNEIFMLKGAAG